MSFIDDLLAAIPDGQLRDVRVGAFWTAVVVDVEGTTRCGLASTLREEDHHHRGKPAIPDAGHLMARSARKLAELIRSDGEMEAAIGMAAINALLRRRKEEWIDLNAEDVIAQHGAGKRVALVGHFPFIDHLRPSVKTLWVLEHKPRGDDLPAESAAQVIPQADVLAITGTALINHTFDELMRFRQPGAFVLMLGPSTPLSPVLFDYGIDVVSGAMVEDLDTVLGGVSQGANFQQLHHLGVRLVNMQRGTS